MCVAAGDGGEKNGDRAHGTKSFCACSIETFQPFIRPIQFTHETADPDVKDKSNKNHARFEPVMRESFLSYQVERQLKVDKCFARSKEDNFCLKSEPFGGRKSFLCKFNWDFLPETFLQGDYILLFYSCCNPCP